MAEDIKLNLKVNVEGDTKIKNVSKDLNKINEESKKNTETISLNQTKYGQMFEAVQKGAKMGVSSFKTLKGAIATTGIGLLIIAITALVNWFKKTETGADLIEKGMKILGQTIKEGPIMVFNALKIVVEYLLIPLRTAISIIKNLAGVLTGKESLRDAVKNVTGDVKEMGNQIVEDAKKIGEAGKNIAEAARMADAWDALDDNRRVNLEKNKQLEAEVAELREKASDTDEKLTDRIKALTEAESKNAELYNVRKTDKEEEIRLIQKELELYPDNAEWIDKLAIAKGELADIDKQYADDKKKIGKQLNTLQKEETNDFIKAQKDKTEALEKANKEQTELAQKQSTELTDIQNRIILASLIGKDKELEQLRQAYEKDKVTYKDNKAALLLIDAEYKTNKEAIDKKYKDAHDKQIKDIEDAEAKSDFAKKEAAAVSLDEKFEIENEKNQLWYEEQQVLYADNQEALALIEDEYNERKIESKKEYDQKLLDQDAETRKKLKEGAWEVAQAVADTYLTIQQAKLNKQTSAETAALATQREKALSNVNLTESQKARINEQFDKKEEALKRQQFERQKKQDIKAILINSVVGAAKTISSVGFPAAWPLLIIQAALAAVQVATVNAQKYKTGGFIVGKSHSNGGVQVEAEGGEYIVNAATMKNPNLANQVIAANNAGNGGYSTTSSSTNNFDYDKLAGLINDKKVYVVEKEINDVQNKRVNIEQMFTV
jgi:hypothetical protein